MNTRVVGSAALLGWAALVWSLPSAALPPRHPPVHPRPPPHYAPHATVWAHGAWHHGWHAERFGWWWVVGPSWYFYDLPVDPYWYPPAAPVLVVPAPPAPAPPTYWYWCEPLKAYYPYVAQCPGAWTPVPTAPSEARSP